MFAVAIAMKWKLRRHLWFWITMTILAVFDTGPADLVWSLDHEAGSRRGDSAPFGMADLYVMLWVLLVVGKRMERAETSDA